jgi:hypothetical protein
LPDQRLALTGKIIIGLPFIRTGQIVVRDTEQPGFAVRIGAATKTFIIQADRRREEGARSTTKMKVCEVGELNTRDVRTKARGLLLRIATGEDPRPKKKTELLAEAKAAERAEYEAERLATTGVPTLRDAWLRFKVSHLIRKKRSPATLRTYTDNMEAVRRLVRRPSVPLATDIQDRGIVGLNWAGLSLIRDRICGRAWLAGSSSWPE